jgi:hypothetical protein
MFVDLQLQKTSFVPCPRLCYISTLIACINLSIVVSMLNHNKLCNKQQAMKTINTNETCNLVLLNNFLKLFLRMPKAFSMME